MNTTTMPYDEFLALHNNGGVVVRMNRDTGDRLRQSLGLPPDADTAAVGIALDRLGRELRDRERGLRSVERGGPLE